MAPQGKAAASAPSCASDAFPSGLYGKYKRATDFFLDWLLRARSAGVGAAPKTTKGNGKKEMKPALTLDVYEQIVMAIAEEPTRLMPELQQLWVRALAACETAIALRARVALFFASAAEGVDSHAHFVKRLRSWLAMLQRAKWPEAAAYVDMKQDTVDFDNYFTALELPDDYFSQESDLTKAATCSTDLDPAAGESKIHCKRLSDDMGDDELKVELSFFFMELEELLEAVHDAYIDVKCGKKTLFEATVITKVAVDCAGKVIARLELRYPWISSCDDVLKTLDDVVLTPEFKTLWDSVLTGWSASPSSEDEQQQARHPKYVSGAMLVDFVWVSKVLQDFVASIPSFTKHKSATSKESDAPYDEERTPQYVWPSMDAFASFFGPQLRVLHEELIAKWEAGHSEPHVLEDWFVSFFKRVVTTRTATLPCVFLVICWARAVGVLQGNGGLQHAIGLSVMRCWGMGERMRDIMANPLNIQKPSQMEIDKCTSTIGQFNELTNVVQANPLLAGCLEIDHLAALQNYGIAMAFTTHRLRTFAHCYHAMVDCKLLDPIPVMEDIFGVYERTIFCPSRRTVVQGSYVASFFASLLRDNPAQLGHGRSKNRRREVVSYQSERGFNVISLIARLLYTSDYSCLPAQSSTVGSWKTLLSSVADVCNEELFETRVLSRDLSKLTNEITSAFHAVVEVMKPLFKGSHPFSNGQQFLTVQEMELVSLVAMLDRSIQKAGNFAEEIKLVSVNPGADAIQDYYLRAADAVSRHFAQFSADVADAVFFVYPRRPEIACSKPSDRVSKSSTTELTAATFEGLMGMLKRSHGPLPDDKFDRLREAVTKDLALLQMRASDSTRELCTLLHHAAAGPAHDRRLVKWLVQVEALSRRRPISFLPAQDSSGAHVPNMTALHCAAKAGLVDMVRILLKAGLMRDVNTSTQHTRETPAHLAVKHGHRKLLRYLVSVNADLWQLDAEGNSVSQLLVDKQWRFQIGCRLPQEVVDETSLATIGSRSREDAAERLRRSFVRYCDQKRAASGSSVETSTNGEMDQSTASKPKSKKSKKTKKKKNAKAGNPRTTAGHVPAMNFIQQHLQ